MTKIKMVHFNLDYEFQQLYERWFMETYPDEYSCKDDFVEKIEAQYHYDDFLKEIDEVK